MTLMSILIISGAVFLVTTFYDFVVRMALPCFRSDLSTRDIPVYPHETVFLFKNASMRIFHALVVVINYFSGAVSVVFLVSFLIKQNLLT